MHKTKKQAVSQQKGGLYMKFFNKKSSIPDEQRRKVEAAKWFVSTNSNFVDSKVLDEDIVLQKSQDWVEVVSHNKAGYCYHTLVYFNRKGTKIVSTNCYEHLGEIKIAATKQETQAEVSNEEEKAENILDKIDAAKSIVLAKSDTINKIIEDSEKSVVTIPYSMLIFDKDYSNANADIVVNALKENITGIVNVTRDGKRKHFLLETLSKMQPQTISQPTASELPITAEKSQIISEEHYLFTLCECLNWESSEE